MVPHDSKSDLPIKLLKMYLFLSAGLAYRREIERTCAFVFLKMDTSPEARTVLSKFSILFEVFWLDRIHT